MITSNEPLPTFPAASVAWHVTVVVPIGNSVALPGVHLTADGSRAVPASEAVTLKLAMAPFGPSASPTRVDGSESTGPVASTVQPRDAVVLLPAASVAFTAKVCAPSASPL